MEGRRLIFADGTTVENGEAGFADNTVVCFVDMSMTEAFRLFGDTNRTSVITYQFGAMENRYEGYTQLAYIMTSDRLTVGLRRPGNG